MLTSDSKPDTTTNESVKTKKKNYLSTLITSTVNSTLINLFAIAIPIFLTLTKLKKSGKIELSNNSIWIIAIVPATILSIVGCVLFVLIRYKQNRSHLEEKAQPAGDAATKITAKFGLIGENNESEKSSDIGEGPIEAGEKSAQPLDATAGTSEEIQPSEQEKSPKTLLTANTKSKIHGKAKKKTAKDADSFNPVGLIVTAISAAHNLAQK